MINIDKAGLEQLLSKLGGAEMITVYTETSPKIKASSPYHNLKKRSKVNGVIKFDYEAGVNRRRIKEGKEADFRSSTTWYTGTQGSALVTHPETRRKYLRISVNNASAQYFDGERPVANEDVRPYLPTKSGSSAQHLDKELIVRTYDLDNIREITINKTHYAVTP